MKMIKKILKVIKLIVISIVIFIAFLAIYNQIALKMDEDKIIPNGQIVNLGDYHIHIYVEGNNNTSPTLVFLSGSATVAPTYDFKAIYSLLSDDYRIAVVEKAGYGYSDIVNVNRDVETMVNEVRSALNIAGIKEPYVLVPHSMSGLEAIFWAQNYPDEVSMIIGIDMSVPEAYDDEKHNLKITRIMMTIGKLSVNLGLLRIPGIYQLNEEPLTKEEIKQQKLLMYRNAVNPVYIAEGNSVYQNAQTVKAKGKIDCPILMFSSNGKEIGDFWIPVQEKFAKENNAKLIYYDCGHYIHYYKSQEMKEQIKIYLEEILK